MTGWTSRKRKLPLFLHHTSRYIANKSEMLTLRIKVQMLAENLSLFLSNLGIEKTFSIIIKIRRQERKD
jgi:hypothetical protein